MSMAMFMFPPFQTPLRQNLLRSSLARPQRAFDPAHPGRGVLAGEMHPPLGPGDLRHQRGHLPRAERGEGAACPRLVAPALDKSLFEVAGDIGKNLPRETEPRLYRCLQLRIVPGPVNAFAERHREHAALTLLAEARVPRFGPSDPGGAVGAIGAPDAPPRLNEKPCRGVVRKFANRLHLCEWWMHVDLPQG